MKTIMKVVEEVIKLVKQGPLQVLLCAFLKALCTGASVVPLSLSLLLIGMT